MKVTENTNDLSLEVIMSQKEALDGLIMSIMKHSGKLFLPYRIVEHDATLQIPEEFSLKLEFIPRGG